MFRYPYPPKLLVVNTISISKKWISTSSGSEEMTNKQGFTQLSQPKPEGFQKFFKPKFVKTFSKDERKTVIEAMKPVATEVAFLRVVRQDNQKKSLIGLLRFATIVSVALGIHFLFFKFVYGQRYFDDETIKQNYHHAKVSIGKRVAVFFDDQDEVLGSHSFLDFFALEKSLDTSKDLLVEIPSLYPWFSMLFVLLLPLIPRLWNPTWKSSSSTFEIKIKSLMEDPRKFQFKKDVAVTTRLNDVAGLSEAKQELLEVIDFLKCPERYTALGAKLPKGVLLDGPPGVGKTLLAKAVAGEASVPFVSCSGSQFDEVYVGVGASRVRELFREAHKCKPCVVFVDEIDSFGQKRKSDGLGGSRGTLNAFLSAVDGFKDSSGIFVLAATNRVDILDSALTRSGRFDRKITLEKPAFKDRVAIAMVHLKRLKLHSASTREEYAECIAALTPGCSGADIYNVCNEAAVHAARHGNEFVTINDFHKAAERVLIGLEKSEVFYQPYEKERLAIHEAGDVVTKWFLHLTDPVIKTTILPRGRHRTGVTQVLPQTIFISTMERLKENITGSLGGYAAEDIFFNDISSRSAGKLQRATELARDMVCRYGMEPSSVGHMGFYLDDNSIQKPFGPEKEKFIDEAVEKIVHECLHKAKGIVLQRSVQVQLISNLLQRHETLSAYDLWLALGDRPVMTKEFQNYTAIVLVHRKYFLQFHRVTAGI
eukprot:gene7185-5047_t